MPELVEAALRAKSTEGITGWGLYTVGVTQVFGGRLVAVAPPRGCNSDDCNHLDHDPEAATYKWLPPEGAKLVPLGDGYYLVVREAGEVFGLRLHRGGGRYWDFLEVVKPEEIPTRVYAKPGKER